MFVHKYILILEKSLVSEHKLKDLKIDDLTSINIINKEKIKKLNKDLEGLREINEKKDIRISDLNENLNKSIDEGKELKIQNKNLLEENKELKKTFYYRIMSLFK